MLHGHRERLQPIGRGYDATVARGLLRVWLAVVEHGVVGAVQLPVPRYGAKVSCMQKCRHG